MNRRGLLIRTFSSALSAGVFTATGRGFSVAPIAARVGDGLERRRFPPPAHARDHALTTQQSIWQRHCESQDA